MFKRKGQVVGPVLGILVLIGLLFVATSCNKALDGSKVITTSEVGIPVTAADYAKPAIITLLTTVPMTSSDEVSTPTHHSSDIGSWFGGSSSDNDSWGSSSGSYDSDDDSWSSGGDSDSGSYDSYDSGDSGSYDSGDSGSDSGSW
jgi:hypothetical protein